MTNGLVNGRWYSYMREDKGGVLSSIPRHALLAYFPVYKVENDFIKYGVFRSSVDFYLYYRGLPSRKEFHEVILGEKEQKARFDIDLEYDKYKEVKPLRRLICPDETEESLEWMIRLGNRLAGKIVDGVVQILTTFKIPFDPKKDIAFYTSHSLENEPYKYSAHLIFPNFCHFNYEEAKEFYRMVVEVEGITMTLAEKSGVLDGSIYASQKSFRIVGSLKKGKRRKERSPFPYQGKIYEVPVPKSERDELDLFRQSCITDVGNAIRLPIIVPEKKHHNVNLDLPDGAEEKIATALGDDFEISEMKGSLVVVRHEPGRETHCIVCDDTHGSENPFLVIQENGEVWYYCRRAIDKQREVTKCLLLTLDGVTRIEDPSENEKGSKGKEEVSPSKGQKSSKKGTPSKKAKKTFRREGVNFDLLQDINYDQVPKNRINPPKKQTVILPKEVVPPELKESEGSSGGRSGKGKVSEPLPGLYLPPNLFKK